MIQIVVGPLPTARKRIVYRVPLPDLPVGCAFSVEKAIEVLRAGDYKGYLAFDPAEIPEDSNEAGAEVLPLNPIEGLTKEEEASGEDYISIMRANLRHLRKALRCQ